MLELQGTGVQVYRCEAVSTGPTWTLVGPEASLATTDGHPAGRHFKGPTWQAPDGSRVTGRIVATASATGRGVVPDAIPWLVLSASAHEGTGVFASVAYITRTRTVGGLAPSAGCNVGTTGHETRVPYRATYQFFGAP